jgi:hypothetical protein
MDYVTIMKSIIEKLSLKYDPLLIKNPKAITLRTDSIKKIRDNILSITLETILKFAT